MKKNVKLSESELNKIISESVNKILNEEQLQANAIIDRIGKEIEPMAQKFSELDLIYGQQLEEIAQKYSNYPVYRLFANFVNAFKMAKKGIDTMEYIYNC